MPNCVIYKLNPSDFVPLKTWSVKPRGVKHAGNAEYPDLKTEDGHGEKGRTWAKIK